MADDIFNFFAWRLGSGDIWVVIEFPEVFMATSKVCTQFRELWHQEDPEDQADSEQVEADEAAAAKRLGLSPYWLKIELDATSGDLEGYRSNLKLHFKFYNMNIMNL